MQPTKPIPFVLPTPINVSLLRELLVDYPIQEDANLLLKGFSEGFTLVIHVTVYREICNA